MGRYGQAMCRALGVCPLSGLCDCRIGHIWTSGTQLGTTTHAPTTLGESCRLWDSSTALFQVPWSIQTLECMPSHGTLLQSAPARPPERDRAMMQLESCTCCIFGLVSKPDKPQAAVGWSNCQSSADLGLYSAETEHMQLRRLHASACQGGVLLI